MWLRELIIISYQNIIGNYNKPVDANPISAIISYQNIIGITTIKFTDS